MSMVIDNIKSYTTVYSLIRENDESDSLAGLSEDAIDILKHGTDYEAIVFFLINEDTVVTADSINGETYDTTTLENFIRDAIAEAVEEAIEETYSERIEVKYFDVGNDKAVPMGIYRDLEMNTDTNNYYYAVFGNNINELTYFKRDTKLDQVEIMWMVDKEDLDGYAEGVYNAIVNALKAKEN